MDKEKITSEKKNKAEGMNPTRVIIIATVVFVVLVVAVLFFGNNAFNRAIIGINSAHIEELAEHDVRIINSSISSRISTLKKMADDIHYWSKKDGTSIKDLLHSDSEFLDKADKITLVSDDGFVFSSNNVIEDRPDIAEVCANSAEKFVCRFDNTVDNIPDQRREYLLYGIKIKPVEVEGHTCSYLCCFIRPANLENELMMENYGGKGFSSVIDADGNYILNINRSHSFLERDNFFEDFENVLDYASVEEFREALTTTTTTTTTARANAKISSKSSEEYYLVFTPMEDVDWYFVSAVPSSIFETQSRGLMQIAGMLLGVVALALAAVIMFTVRSRRLQHELEEKAATDALNVQLKEQQTSLEESLAFMDFFLEQYEAAYYVDLKDCSCKVYRRTEKLENEYPITDDYFSSLKEYINTAVHPDDREELTAALEPRTLMAELQRVPSFSRIFRDISSGAERIYKVQVIRGADEDHMAFGFLDMTEEYQEQQKHLLGAIPLSSDVLTKANIGLWSFELDEGCEPRMYADKAMLGLIGLDHQIPPEETYHAWYDNIDNGSYDLVADAVAKMTSGEHAEVQYPWHNPNGETWIVRCGGVRNFEYTKGIRIEGTHQNVSELLHYDEEQRKREEKQRLDELARVQAEASSKAKTEFLFNMSHDIRTPMNAILGFTDIALNHIDEPDRVGDSLKKIKISGGHLLNLINDILEMSRIEAGKMEIVPAPINVYEVTEGVVTMSRSLAETKDITFNVKADSLKNPYIYSDELHTNQVIINLISNAIKYTNPGGTVDYSVEQISDSVDGIARYRVTVKDNGIGMSEEFQEHLFESFSREQSATVSKQEGAGLGLAIVKKIIDMMGGTIAVQSKLGEGSTFVVELPFEVMDEKAIEEFEASRKKDIAVTDEISFDGQKVLLVEDNEMNREIATEILEEVGLVIETAEDGAIAVRKVMEKGTSYYDFILMDIQMPVMNGYEATAKIRELPGGSEIPIIALSANAFKEDVDRSLAVGMNAHAVKPIDVRSLFETIQRLVK